MAAWLSLEAAVPGAGPLPTWPASPTVDFGEDFQGSHPEPPVSLVAWKGGAATSWFALLSGWGEFSTNSLRNKARAGASARSRPRFTAPGPAAGRILPLYLWLSAHTSPFEVPSVTKRTRRHGPGVEGADTALHCTRLEPSGTRGRASPPSSGAPHVPRPFREYRGAWAWAS